MRRPVSAAALLVAAVAIGATGARASCGAAFCPLDTHAFNLPPAGSWALDLSFQYIDQDQPRIGTRSAAVGELPSEHDEVRTINRTATLGVRYAPTSRLLLGVNSECSLTRPNHCASLAPQQHSQCSPSTRQAASPFISRSSTRLSTW